MNYVISMFVAFTIGCAPAVVSVQSRPRTATPTPQIDVEVRLPPAMVARGVEILFASNPADWAPAVCNAGTHIRSPEGESCVVRAEPFQDIVLHFPSVQVTEADCADATVVSRHRMLRNVAHRCR